MPTYTREAIRTNMIQLYELLSLKSPLVSFERTPRYTRMETEIPFVMFNRVFDYKGTSGVNLVEDVRILAAKYRERGIKGSWLTYSHESELAVALEEALTVNQYTKVGTMSGMSLMLDDWNFDQPAPHGVEMVLAKQKSGFEDFKKVMAAGYEMPDSIAGPVGRVLIDDAKDEPSLQYYVAYLDKQPACCVMTYLNNGVAGVYAVATLEEFRQKGIAGAAVAHSLREAKVRGAGQAILQASGLGKSVYAKLGFKEEMLIPIYTG